MFSASTVYAFDLETSTDGVNGLDPRESRITEIAVSTETDDVVFADYDEADLIRNFDRFLLSLEPGLLVTWNGHFFDLPFIVSRWNGVDGSDVPFVSYEDSLAGRTGYELGMHPIARPGLIPKYDYLPGYTTALGCTWRSRSPWQRDVHSHLDISDAYRSFAAEQGIKHRLKPVCIASGIPMIEVDRENMHLLTPAERAAYACSDTRGTRELAIRLLGAS